MTGRAKPQGIRGPVPEGIREKKQKPSETKRLEHAERQPVKRAGKTLPACRLSRAEELSDAQPAEAP